MVLPDAGALDGMITMLSDSLRANAPGAMGDSKRLVHHVAGKHIDGGLMDDTARRIARARVSDEGQEGVRAFLDKRKPRWAE
jgi:methylglutaconyl-CoA hydratase